MRDGIDQIADDEILFRRIPVSLNWWDGTTLSPQAFGPNSKDETGISLSRKLHVSLQDAARGQPGKKYYVAELLARDVRNHGIVIEHRPRVNGEYRREHVEFPQIRLETKKNGDVLEFMRLLSSQLTLRGHGPFPDDITTAESLLNRQR